MIIFATIPSLVQAAAPAEQWNNTYGGTVDDSASSIQQTSDGGFIVAGYTQHKLWLFKVDSSGNRQWNKYFTQYAPYYDSINMKQASDGGYVIAGPTWFIKVDGSGNQQWDMTFTAQSCNIDSVQQTSDGGYILAGGKSDTNNYVTWLIKVDPDGNQVWDQTFEPGVYGEIYSVQQTSDGGYIIACSKYYSDVGFLIKADSNGEEQWTKSLSVQTHAIQQASDGGYLLAGSKSSDALLLKVDTSGTEKWRKTFGGSGSDCMNSLEKTSDGGYILAGYTYGQYGNLNKASNDAWLIKVDSSGNQKWSKICGGIQEEKIHSAIETSDSGYILAGYTYSYGLGVADAWLVKIGGITSVDNPPVANAGADNTVTVGTSVTFDGSASTDDKGIASYSWDFDYSNGITADATTKTTSKTYTAAGTYTVTLTVTDTAGQKSTDTLQVTVSSTVDDPSVAPAEKWNHTYGGTVDDSASSIQQTSDGGFIVAGYTQHKLWLFKVDSSGNRQWNKYFTQYAPYYDSINMKQASDGGYVIAGPTWFIKVDSNGDQQWSMTFTAQSCNIDSVQQTSDGGYILAGGKSDTDNYVTWLVKVDPDGNQVWDQTFEPGVYGEIYSVQQTSDGGYIIACSKYYSDVGFLIKTDSNGEEQWTKSLSVQTHAIQQASDGGYLLAGSKSSDALLLKVDTSGTEKWRKTFGGSGSDCMDSLEKTSDGGYILTGYTYGQYGNLNKASNDAWLIKVDSSGNQKWSKICGGIQEEKIHSAIETSDSGYILAGYTYSYGLGAADAWLVKIGGITYVDNPPVANAGADKTITVGSSVSFDGSASTDDKGIASYSWDFDYSNGITADATTKIASKTYTAAGTYTVTLTVTDTAGQKSTDTLQVTVLANDWNPWNDPSSESGEKIALSELQTAIYDWRYGIALSTGEIVDLSRLQGLIYSWRFG